MSILKTTIDWFVFLLRNLIFFWVSHQIPAENNLYILSLWVIALDAESSFRDHIAGKLPLKISSNCTIEEKCIYWSSLRTHQSLADFFLHLKMFWNDSLKMADITVKAKTSIKYVGMELGYSCYGLQSLNMCRGFCYSYSVKYDLILKLNALLKP